MTETKDYKVVIEYLVDNNGQTMVAGFDASQDVGTSHLFGEYEDGYNVTFADMILERLDRNTNAVYIGNLDEIGLSQEEREHIEELIPGEEPLESETVYGDATDERFEEKTPEEVLDSGVKN